MIIAIIIVTFMVGIGVGAAIAMAAYEREAAMNQQYFTQSTIETPINRDN